MACRASSIKPETERFLSTEPNADLGGLLSSVDALNLNRQISGSGGRVSSGANMWGAEPGSTLWGLGFRVCRV